MTTASSTDDQWRDGYVAMIDVLGWKGIWNRHKHAGEILSAARAIKQSAARMDVIPSRKFGDRDPYMFATSVFLSDTLVVGVSPTGSPFPFGDNETDREARLVGAMCNWICQSVAWAMNTGAEQKPALLFRGAVAKGRFIIDENLILGPAIDEASALMSLATAAIVWFAPNSFVPDDWNCFHAIPYSIPLHGGQTVHARAVNPFQATAPTGNIDDTAELEASILSAFGQKLPLDVEIKKQNTAAFLTFARQVTANGGRLPTS